MADLEQKTGFLRLKNVEWLLIVIAVVLVGWKIFPDKLSIITPPASSSGAPAIQMSDYVFYRAAAEIVTSPQAGQIYDIHVQDRVQSAIVGAAIDSYTQPLYPPHSLLFLAPFSLGSAMQSFIGWFALSLICTLVMLWIGKVEITELPQGALLVAAMLILSFDPWITTLRIGQSMTIITAAIWGGYALSKRGNYWLASLALILGAFKPQLAAGPILYLLMLQGWTMWRSILVCAAVVFAICTYHFGAAIWLEYLHALSHAPASIFGVSGAMTMCSLRTLLLFLLGDAHASWINGLSPYLWLIGIFTCAWLGEAARRRDSHFRDLAFGLVVTLTCLLSPYLHAHGMLLLLIPLAYLVKYQGKWMFYSVAAGTLMLSFASRFEHYNPLTWGLAQILLVIYLAKRLFFAAGTNARFTK